MKVLIEAPAVAPTMLNAWCQALTVTGFEAAVLPDYERVFDVFRDYKPDIFISTKPPNRAISKCIAARPRMKVVDMAGLRPAFDSVTYNRGEPNPALACDLAFVAHWTPEKIGLYREFLDPVIEHGGYAVKCFGAGEVCPYVQHLGWLDHSLLPDLYRSSDFCLDLSHGPFTERRYQIVGLGGGCVSNNRVFDGDSPVETPDALLKALDGNLTAYRRPSLQTYVRSSETYFNRLADGFLAAGLVNQAADLIKKGQDYVRCD